MGNKREASSGAGNGGGVGVGSHRDRSSNNNATHGTHERQELHFSIWTAIATYFGYGIPHPMILHCFVVLAFK